MNLPSATGAGESLTAPILIVDGFMPPDIAKAMRTDVEAHFSNAASHRPETHNVWDYWYVPGLYTYLRTQPERVVARGRIEQFVAALEHWATDNLGLGGVSWPFLSLYVNGCGQGLHNDSRNGRFGYVYSLTPAERHTIGGETMVMKEGDLVRRNARAANAGTGLYDLIEPRFNRLILFDDRMVHGVQRVSGSMDPLDGRCVMHGHLGEIGPIVAGALPKEAIRDAIGAAIQRFAAQKTVAVATYHGPIVLRFTITAEGRVSRLSVLLDRVIDELGNDAKCQAAKLALAEALSQSLFPSAPGETTVTLPVMFGGPVNRPREE
jgi:hypothetical protein